MTSIRNIAPNSDGMVRTIRGQRVYIQTRCSGGVLEVWAWRGGRKLGAAHTYVRGSSFFDHNDPRKNRAYFDEIVARNLGLSAGASAMTELNVGDRVEGGNTPEGYDTGTVLGFTDGGVLVAWDSGVRTSQPAELLRPEGSAPVY